MNPDEIRAYACATCNGTGLYDDDDTCRDCSGTGIDNHN
jgi:DnaJ-class molecular chaperone